MTEICVVHLVRDQNGVEPFKRFLNSYIENNAGIDHDLLIVFKGFGFNKNIVEYEKLLKNIPHNTLFVCDFGFDIRAYMMSAKTFDCKYFCFLNSYSIVQDENWLLKMYDYITKNGVGLVGATGSYESLYSDVLNSPELKERTCGDGIRISIANSIRTMSKRIMRRLKQRSYESFFDPFPNYHIRTNAFMISRELMCKIKHKIVLTKMDAHRFESGKNSMTRQIQRMNLRVLVVGKDGKGYEKEDWWLSNTFRRVSQENLLIADNQTRRYLTSNLDIKLQLSRSSWGENASVIS